MLERIPKIVLLFGIVAIIQSANAFDSFEIKKNDCPTLPECLGLVSDLAGPNGELGMSSDSVGLADKIATLGDDAIDPAFKLIDSEHSGVVKIGESILGESDFLDDSHLDAILSLLDQRPELTGLPRALGSIDSLRAAEESLRRYLASGSNGNQYFVAVKAHNERVIPFLVKAIKCEYRCDDKAYSLISSAIKELGKDSRGAVAEKAAKLISDESASDELVSNVLSLFYSIGEIDIDVESSLESLFETRPSLRPLEIEMALVGVYSKRSGEIFSNWLNGSDLSFDAIARVIFQRADVAYDAGPTLERFLKSDDEEIVRRTIGLLGAIGYLKSVPKILPFLKDSTDIFINISAIDALGNLKAIDAKDELSKIVSSYWYPPIRQIALTSLEKIDGTFKERDEFLWDGAIIPVMGLWGDIQLCEEITKKKVDESQNIKLYRSHAEIKLSSLAFESEIVGYTAFDEEAQVKDAELKGEKPFIEVNPSNIVEVREPDIRIPHVALKHELGWLAGTDKGEWVGEVVFIDKNKHTHFILKDNVEDIYNLGDRYFVVAGTSHLGLSDGSVYELFLKGNGWDFKKIHSLPDTPFSSWIVESGEVLINTYAGNILLSPEGVLSMAECAD